MKVAAHSALRWPRFAAVLLAAACLSSAVSNQVYAVEPDEVLADPKLEARAREISAGLRCLVCQNQSIDDSNAPLARDLRLLVRERLQAGDSDAGVRSFLVDRYGDFVLLKPPFNLATLLLWLAPLLALLGGIAVVWRTLRRPEKAASGAPGGAVARLSASEEARLAKLLAENDLAKKS